MRSRTKLYLTKLRNFSYKRPHEMTFWSKDVSLIVSSSTTPAVNLSVDRAQLLSISLRSHLIHDQLPGPQPYHSFNILFSKVAHINLRIIHVVMLVTNNDQRNVHTKRRIAQISVLIALAVGYFCIIIDTNDNLNDSDGTRALSIREVASTRELARGVREVRREHRKRQRRLANTLKDEVAATKEELDEWAKQQQQLDEWAKVLKDADEELAEVDNVQVATTPEKKNLSFSEKLEEAQKMLEEYAMAYPAESVEQIDNVPLFEPAQDILQSEWCTAPTEPPIPYDRCRWDSMVMRFGVYGGLTNALHFILKGAIWAMEEDVCFFVSELHGKFVHTFLKIYFDKFCQHG